MLAFQMHSALVVSGRSCLCGPTPPHKMQISQPELAAGQLETRFDAVADVAVLEPEGDLVRMRCKGLQSSLYGIIL